MIVLGWISIVGACLAYLWVGVTLAMLYTMDGSPRNRFLRVVFRFYCIFLWPTMWILPFLGMLVS